MARFYDTKMHDYKTALSYYERYYTSALPGELNELDIEFLYSRIRQLKEELHFEAQ